MISAFRRYIDTWVVRGFFIIMVAAFIFWGVGDVVRQIGFRTWVAKVGGETIEPLRFQEQFQRVPHLVTVADVSWQVDLSPRRFSQLFTEQVGLTPKLYCRVQRFQQVLRTIASQSRVDHLAGTGIVSQKQPRDGGACPKGDVLIASRHDHHGRDGAAQPHLMALRGKRLVVASESSSGARVSAEQIKRISQPAHPYLPWPVGST